MKHECGLCLRDNKVCKDGKSFWQIALGKVKDCMIYEDYTQKLMKEQIRMLNKEKLKRLKEVNNLCSKRDT
jgi:hypothetical protein